MPTHLGIRLDIGHKKCVIWSYITSGTSSYIQVISPRLIKNRESEACQKQSLEKGSQFNWSYSMQNLLFDHKSICYERLLRSVLAYFHDIVITTPHEPWPYLPIGTPTAKSTDESWL